MTERDSGNYDVQRGFGEKTRSLIAKGLVAVTLLTAAPGVRAEETPAPANPNVTPSVEADENKTKDGFPTTVEGYTPAPGNPLETKYVTDAYELVLEERSLNREFLKENECQPENLECCARTIYAIKNGKNGFKGSGFDWPEKTVLSNYVTIDNIVEYGRTGKCILADGVKLEGIRDNNGKLIFFYIGESDFNVGVDTIEKAILSWDPNRQDFLEYIEANDVCVFFQNKANKSTGTVAKFGFGILYFNYGKADKKAGGKKETYSNSVQKILGAESIANRLRMIEGNDLEYVSDSPILKLELAIDFTEFLVKENGGKFYKNMLKQYKSILEDYKERYPAVGDIKALVTEIKDKNLVTPFGTSWEEIDKVVG